MKVLYITNYKQIAIASGGFINDYLNDLTFHGFYELYKSGFISEIVDSTPIVCLYKQYESNIPKQNIWGGMSSCWLIDNDDVDRSNINEKIKDKYYDIIIYGACRRCLGYYDIVSKVYDPKKVIMLDGNDDSDIKYVGKNHIYFKRELYSDYDSVLPISFSYPSIKLGNVNRNKTQDYGTVIPGDKSTYIFKEEQPYYDDYNKSFYGVTSKKAGWDCMRHYEILGNYCIPYFIGLENCPKNTLTNFPKELLLESRELTNNFNEEKYFSILDELYKHTKKHLTTKSIAQYILDQIK